MDELLERLADMVADRVLAKLGAEKDLYTVNDLSERYALSKDAIRKKVRAGEFGETVNCGEKSYLIPKEGVRKYDFDHMGKLGRYKRI